MTTSSVVALPELRRLRKADPVKGTDSNKGFTEEIGKKVERVRGNVVERIEDLRLKHETVREKLKELKEAGEDAWGDLEAGVELAWDSLGEAVKSANSRFK